MIYRFFRLFAILIFLFSCKNNENHDVTADDEIILSFDKIKKTSITRDISYLPNWQERIEFEGSFYIPLNTDKQIYSFTPDSVKYSLIGRIWLKVNKQGGVWNFTKLTVLPNDIQNSKGSGLFIYEDWQTGELSYEGYIEKRLLRAVSYEQEMRRMSGKIDKKAQNSPVGVTCQFISFEVCAGSGINKYCSQRGEFVCSSTTIPGGGNGGNTNPPPVGSGGHGGGSGGGNNTPPIVVDDTPSEEEKEVKNFNDAIDDTNLPDCMKQVLAALKNLNGNTVADIIKKFAGDVPGYNWKVTFSDKTMDLTQFAGTDLAYLTDKGQVTTVLNPDPIVFKYTSDLSLAKTLIHESIHAYLTTLYYTDRQVILESYPEMLSKFLKQHKKPENDVQHDILVKYFISDIAKTLKSYGTEVGYRLPDQFYSDLAWGGLLSTRAFSMLPEQDRLRIQGTVNSEQYGNNVTTNGQTQKGKKMDCNN